MYIFGKEHLATKQNILKDNIGFVSIYDFSRANSSLEARIHAITSVASICYAKPDAVDKGQAVIGVGEYGGYVSDRKMSVNDKCYKQQFDKRKDNKYAQCEPKRNNHRNKRRVALH